MIGRAGWWIVRASLARERGRARWSVASLALVSALVASLLGINARVGERARTELGRFGPNVVVVPSDIGAPGFPAPWLPSVDVLRSLGVEVAVGLRHETRPLPGGGSEIVAGVALLDAAGGSAPSWANPGADPGLLTQADRLVEIAELGPAPDAWDAVALRVRPDAVDGFVDDFGRTAPGLSARVVRSVAFAEARVLRRTGAFVLGIALILVALSGLCLASTLMAQWIDRRGEVGLLLALGGTRRRLARLFAAEIAVLALSGGVIGAAGGSILGWWILRRGFAWDGSILSWPAWTLVAAVAATLVVAAIGSALPLLRAVKAEPLAALRAE